ncbi:MAG: hypothetical protein H7062_18695 [Candidatus Saccharimonas sp.]|nr:hypothetical protein [Planctomycetaceae bacterium]
MSVTAHDVHQALAARLSFLNGPLSAASPLAQTQLDSLDLLELLMVIDELYAVRFSPEELRSVTTVGELTQWVAARTSEANS